MNSRTHGIATIVFGASLMLSACERSTPENADTREPLVTESPSLQGVEEAEHSQPEASVENLANQEENLADQEGGDAPNGVESVDQLSGVEHESEESNEGEELKTALVEDMGFSTETETELDSKEDVAAKPFCLGNESNKIVVTAAQACDQIAGRLASVTSKRCNAASLEPSSCASVDGFPIFVREFPPLEDRKSQGRILVIGGIHGDELTSVSIVFKWIAKLNKFHSGLFHWHVVPMMNPDGVLQKGAQRTNRNGVDLNRNLPSADWEENALQYWRHKQGENPRRYPGEQPASEPETQWLIDEINEFKPDAIISVHAPYGVVDFDALLLSTAPKSLGKLHLNLLGTYPGSLGNYAGINRDIPVITLELPHAWEMPSEQETTQIWEDIVSWLRKNVNTEIADSD